MTEKRNAKAVLLVDDVDDPGSPPGSFNYFVGSGSPDVIGMVFRCPCGCGDLSGIEFDNVPPKPPRDTHRWHWNGNRETPTLTPSLHKTDGCGWHGFLTNGEFLEC